MDFSLSAILTSSGKDLAASFHHLAPMHFDDGFIGTEFPRNLQYPGNDKPHRVTQFSSVSLLFADDAISTQPPSPVLGPSARSERS